MVVPNNNLSIAEGAIEPWNKSSNDFYQQTLIALSEAFNFSMEKPFKDLKKEVQNIILYGSKKKKKLNLIIVHLEELIELKELLKE